MSVTTTADRTIDQLRKDVKQAFHSAHKAYTELLVEKVWGHDERSVEFKQKLIRYHTQLMEMHNELGDPQLD